VILVPTFLEALPTPVQTIHILMIVAFVWLYAWALGDFVLERTYEGFQSEVYEDSDLFFLKQRGKCPWSICTYYISVNSVELELHARSKLACTPMLGLTRIVW
jgi:hypothetical protein